MPDWKETTLDKLGFISRGRQTHYPKNDPNLFWKGTIPFVETQDVKEAKLFVRQIRRYYNQKGLEQGKLFPINTVCITNNANVADSALLRESSCLSCDVYGFNAYEGISCPRFIKYCFDFAPIKKECISVAQAGTTRLSLTSERLLTIKFPNLSFETQKKIGDILSAYDELIENCERQIELLEELRTSLYKEWFINLRFPNHENCEINKGLPEDWKILDLKKITQIFTGKRNANFAKKGGPYLFFTCGEKALNCDTYAFDAEAIVLSGNGNFYLRIYRGKFDAYQRVYVLIPEKDLIYLSFGAIDSNLRSLSKNSKGSTIKFLTLDMLQNIEVVYPTKEIINLFNETCLNIQLKIENLDAKMRKN
ncbi:hypothetical protein A6V39_03145 [Candidatus Mycoplasma haematobovis]|uniref:Type I restriction modification DNA specificity domain-containing protein n=1 Tax=Candidatus Mycoplasma haematobovis TaxID=432608 RepID=A0A1A9QEM0_9MOLU|nr:restriction endonuclease subunit S [Candidatus Mycoplasma haematobovis]OAL10405.1 hypothetical protein A6V39_03145 [Candidatus Mycoplasma haematobovis]